MPEICPRSSWAIPKSSEVGEWVVAIGSPFGSITRDHQGIVSAKGRNAQRKLRPPIQTDVAISPGSSGGPLFNLNGEVVGINSRFTPAQAALWAMSFAISYQ